MSCDIYLIKRHDYKVAKVPINGTLLFKEHHKRFENLEPNLTCINKQLFVMDRLSCDLGIDYDL